MSGGPSAEHAIGTNVFDLIAPEDRERYRAFHETVCAGQRGRASNSTLCRWKESADTWKAMRLRC